jgi:hypothetical protein
MIPRVPPLAVPKECALRDQIRQIARRRRRRRADDGAVFSRAKPAFESFWTFPEHAQQRFLLSLVELAFQAVQWLRFVDQEFD